MRKYGVLIGSLVCSLAVVAACGTDDPAPQTTATTSAGGSGPGAGAGGQGTGGTTPGGCVEVTAIDNFSTSPFVPNVFFTDTDRNRSFKRCRVPDVVIENLTDGVLARLGGHAGHPFAVGVALQGQGGGALRPHHARGGLELFVRTD